MERRFDRVAKILAGSVSRRTTIGWIGATTLGALLAPPFARRAAAACSPGTCPQPSCSGGDCTCVTTVKNKGFCHQPQFCSGLMSCTKNRQCREAFGRGWKCCTSCCAGTKCLPKCGATLAGPRVAPGGGLTSAG
jgi:hypothetical protein